MIWILLLFFTQSHSDKVMIAKVHDQFSNRDACESAGEKMIAKGGFTRGGPDEKHGGIRAYVLAYTCVYRDKPGI
jgi:hypothetical protein